MENMEESPVYFNHPELVERPGEDKIERMLTTVISMLLEDRRKKEEYRREKDRKEEEYRREKDRKEEEYRREKERKEEEYRREKERKEEERRKERDRKEEEYRQERKDNEEHRKEMREMFMILMGKEKKQEVNEDRSESRGEEEKEGDEVEVQGGQENIREVVERNEETLNKVIWEMVVEKKEMEEVMVSGEEVEIVREILKEERDEVMIEGGEGERERTEVEDSIRREMELWEIEVIKDLDELEKQGDRKREKLRTKWEGEGKKDRLRRRELRTWGVELMAIRRKQRRRRRERLRRETGWRGMCWSEESLREVMHRDREELGEITRGETYVKRVPPERQ